MKSDPTVPNPPGWLGTFVWKILSVANRLPSDLTWKIRVKPLSSAGGEVVGGWVKEK